MVDPAATAAISALALASLILGTLYIIGSRDQRTEQRRQHCVHFLTTFRWIRHNRRLLASGGGGNLRGMVCFAMAGESVESPSQCFMLHSRRTRIGRRYLQLTVPAGRDLPSELTGFVEWYSHNTCRVAVVQEEPVPARQPSDA